MCVCVLVYVSIPEGMNNQWCNMDPVRLVKQVLLVLASLHVTFHQYS